MQKTDTLFQDLYLLVNDFYEKNLRELAGHFIRDQEEERRRISHELHDEIGQSLSALKLELDLLALDLEDGAVKNTLNRAGKIARLSLDRIQKLSDDLRPPELDIIGLNAALNDLCIDFARHTDFTVEYYGTELPANISDTIKVTLYRALQVSLTHSAKRAQANHVSVHLKHKDGQISLTVKDNGSGLSQPPEAAGTIFGEGLDALSERFTRLGGSVTLSSEAQEGTTLLILVTE